LFSIGGLPVWVRPFSTSTARSLKARKRGPYVGGGESFIGIYKDLVPPGAKSFGSMVMTVLANPAFTMSTLAEMDKLSTCSRSSCPWRSFPSGGPSWLVLAIPGFFFTVLSTHYGALVSINFQYSAHWIAFFFPGVALGLEWMERRGA
jgi:hypothetical protein